MAFLILYMALIFLSLISSKTNNLSLGFRVGKFRDGGLFDIVYSFIFPNLNFKNKTKNLSLRFIVGKFRGRDLFNIIYGPDFPLFSLNKISPAYNPNSKEISNCHFVSFFCLCLSCLSVLFVPMFLCMFVGLFVCLACSCAVSEVEAMLKSPRRY